jgi:hypothetical protein
MNETGLGLRVPMLKEQGRPFAILCVSLCLKKCLLRSKRSLAHVMQRRLAADLQIPAYWEFASFAGTGGKIE